MYYEKQIERHAIVSYVVYGVKLALPLRASAKRELARLRRSTAALADMQAYAEHRPRPFAPRACQLPNVCECVMCTRNAAYRMQQRRELIASIATSKVQ